MTDSREKSPLRDLLLFREVSISLRAFEARRENREVA
jgi:hypothetical protein